MTTDVKYKKWVPNHEALKNVKEENIKKILFKLGSSIKSNFDEYLQENFIDTADMEIEEQLSIQSARQIENNISDGFISPVKEGCFLTFTKHLCAFIVDISYGGDGLDIDVDSHSYQTDLSLIPIRLVADNMIESISQKISGDYIVKALHNNSRLDQYYCVSIKLFRDELKKINFFFASELVDEIYTVKKSRDINKRKVHINDIPIEFDVILYKSKVDFSTFENIKKNMLIPIKKDKKVSILKQGKTIFFGELGQNGRNKTILVTEKY